MLFVQHLSSIATCRLDYPILDDWRYCQQGGMPLGLNFMWLIKPAQDTLHVKGKFLDWFFLPTEA